MESGAGDGFAEDSHSSHFSLFIIFFVTADQKLQLAEITEGQPVPTLTIPISSHLPTLCKVLIINRGSGGVLARKE